MTGGTAHLKLAIEVGSDPIAGSVSDGPDGSQRFKGWIELVAAIEAARSSATRVAGGGEAGVQRLGFLPGAKASEL